MPFLPARYVLLLTAIGLVSAPGTAVTRESAAAGEPTTLRELIDVSVTWYQVFPDADAKEAAEVLTALRWANNARGSEDGMTVLFVHGGRPLAAACVFPWERRLEYNFESLSRDNIVARRDGQVVWQPQASSVAFADVPDAPAADATRPRRLRQMKSLAERFQATLLGWKADSTDREELRRLSRPLYRYDPKEGPIVDGAVFAFVMGTDPEVLLLLEAVQGDDDSNLASQEDKPASWQFAFARRTSGELEGRLDGKVVWNAPRFPQQHDSRLPYFTLGQPLPANVEIDAGELPASAQQGLRPAPKPEPDLPPKSP